MTDEGSLENLLDRLKQTERERDELKAERDRLLRANANNLSALQDHTERLRVTRVERDEARKSLDRAQKSLARFEPLCASCGGFNAIPAPKPCRACGTSTVHQAGPRG